MILRPCNSNEGPRRQFADGVHPPLMEYLTMLRLALVCLVVALIAAFLGFTGIASLSWEGVKIFVFIFLILAVVSFLGGSFHRRYYSD
jgi:uncharacterized membrane protein YtjA (UPF0391 family)